MGGPVFLPVQRETGGAWPALEGTAGAGRSASDAARWISGATGSHAAAAARHCGHRLPGPGASAASYQRERNTSPGKRDVSNPRKE